MLHAPTTLPSHEAAGGQIFAGSVFVQSALLRGAMGSLCLHEATGSSCGGGVSAIVLPHHTQPGFVVVVLVFLACGGWREVSSLATCQQIVACGYCVY